MKEQRTGQVQPQENDKRTLRDRWNGFTPAQKVISSVSAAAVALGSGALAYGALIRSGDAPPPPWIQTTHVAHSLHTVDASEQNPTIIRGHGVLELQQGRAIPLSLSGNTVEALVTQPTTILEGEQQASETRYPNAGDAQESFRADLNDARQYTPGKTVDAVSNMLPAPEGVRVVIDASPERPVIIASHGKLAIREPGLWQGEAEFDADYDFALVTSPTVVDSGMQNATSFRYPNSGDAIESFRADLGDVEQFEPGKSVQQTSDLPR